MRTSLALEIPGYPAIYREFEFKEPGSAASRRKYRFLRKALRTNSRAVLTGTVFPGNREFCLKVAGFHSSLPSVALQQISSSTQRG